MSFMGPLDSQLAGRLETQQPSMPQWMLFEHLETSGVFTTQIASPVAMALCPFLVLVFGHEVGSGLPHQLGMTIPTVASRAHVSTCGMGAILFKYI